MSRSLRQAVLDQQLCKASACRRPPPARAWTVRELHTSKKGAISSHQHQHHQAHTPRNTPLLSTQMAQSNAILQVYGGDEVAALVLDPGSQTTRAGYSGDDMPRIITPSFVGFNAADSDAMDVDDDDDDTGSTKPVKKRANTYFAENSIEYPKPGAELQSIVKDGVIQDWDSALEQWQYIFDNLCVDYSEQPLLLTEPVWNTEENRKKSLEVALEQFQFPGFYLASSPTCVAFAQGRPSALVVDIGHDLVSVTPVVDGMCLARSTLKTHYAGRYVSTQLHKRLTAQATEVIPLYRVKSKVFTQPTEPPNWVPKQLTNITKSYDDYQVEKTLLGIKEAILKVPRAPLKNAKLTEEEALEAYPRRQYELPNGHAITMAKERFELTDCLFDPETYAIEEYGPESGEPEINSKNDYVPLKRPLKKSNDDDTSTNKSKKSKKDIPKYRGLTQLTSYALSLVDVDIRAQLAHNIIVTGGGSLLTGLNERMFLELTADHPGLKIRVNSSGSSAERKFQSWIGGSVLSSLGTFHQLWVSKKEYEEVGVDRLLAQRFR